MSELIVIDLDRAGTISEAEQDHIVRWFAAEIRYQQTRSCCQHQACQEIRAEAVRS